MMSACFQSHAEHAWPNTMPCFLRSAEYMRLPRALTLPTPSLLPDAALCSSSVLNNGGSSMTQASLTLTKTSSYAHDLLSIQLL